MQAASDTPEAVTERIEAAFAAIQRDRMAGVPIVNPALSVAAIGTRSWNEDWLAILVTPWCMNILLLPGRPESAAWREPRLGSVARRALPSGEYSFILGEEPALGRFQMCSLFSPMLQFADQDAAVATAQAAMIELMTPAMPQEAAAQPATQPATKTPVSRRGLFGLDSAEISA